MTSLLKCLENYADECKNQSNNQMKLRPTVYKRKLVKRRRSI